MSSRLIHALSAHVQIRRLVWLNWTTLELIQLNYVFLKSPIQTSNNVLLTIPTVNTKIELKWNDHTESDFVISTKNANEIGLLVVTKLFLHLKCMFSDCTGLIVHWNSYQTSAPNVSFMIIRCIAIAITMSYICVCGGGWGRGFSFRNFALHRQSTC